ncbi:MAG: hypothetical protein GY913_32010 [Proteobacteria bacterium]|nr:hypothetical protein [Pseudomonadota bacterium]MCP4921546.1 hypothetical protein [Pseudomonadota bacterium]
MDVDADFQRLVEARDLHVDAATCLAGCPGIRPRMYHIVESSKSAAEVAVALDVLNQERAASDRPLFLAALQHEAPRVRRQAALGLRSTELQAEEHQDELAAALACTTPD